MLWHFYKGPGGGEGPGGDIYRDVLKTAGSSYLNSQVIADRQGVAESTFTKPWNQQNSLQSLSFLCYPQSVYIKGWGWSFITWRVDPMTMLRSARVEWAVEISRSLLGSSSSQSRTKSHSLPRQGRLSPCWWQFVPRGFWPTENLIKIHSTPIYLFIYLIIWPKSRKDCVHIFSRF